MKTYFEISQGALARSGPERAQVVVYGMPDEAEKQELLDALHIDRYTLESAFDPDEIPRVEFTPDQAYIIWKRPANVSFEDALKFQVSSLGLCLQPNRLTIIVGEKETAAFESRALQRITSPADVLLKFLLGTIHHYLGHLKAMKQLTAELQEKLNVSMENRYLIQMFTLSESLVYYQNALETSAAVLTKLRANADKIGFSKEEVDTLDDVIIEHQQCATQTKIYSMILSGLMDARGNIINNNMNVLLKNLTLINVVFLPLTLIASIGGMSEFSMITSGVAWWISYSIFSLGMIGLGLTTWYILIKRIGQARRKDGDGREQPVQSRPAVGTTEASGKQAP